MSIGAVEYHNKSFEHSLRNISLIAFQALLSWEYFEPSIFENPQNHFSHLFFPVRISTIAVLLKSLQA